MTDCIVLTPAFLAQATLLPQFNLFPPIFLPSEPKALHPGMAVPTHWYLHRLAKRCVMRVVCVR